MLDGVLVDMRRGNISHVLVKGRAGVSVWRRGSGVAGAWATNPSPQPSPHRMGRGRRFLPGRVPGVALVPRLPRATFLNPSGVLKSGRLAPAKKGGGR
jgi:hypothetical protein